ncbi:unnamed protein product (macronuclear) [Paramecium tetraurelia]|uniref:Pre-mRNA-processing factor 19 n=1 Tax=Paramecium tetraurelia TaxID=5888 RepID=A0BKI9_PARTE|nr:uncharacterized protein GSPATT00029687001 [Paramecium tetraurelia]CAK59056.1 unnamed protein product [Paramecium tetraurelia]|eukprot:XP_001426454.1 hypothetical protein (macronuclear) [Paramecium tetraurelia strain d4-2]
MQSWQTCALSGELIETPVISKVSGHIYEKRLIEKHIESTGTCPITGRPLNFDDLIEVKVAKVQKPRPVTATSIPSLLSLLQNEWDALLLEQFQLKQHLEQVRHELTHALYQHDAACRVIAKLIKERDQARIELAQLQNKLNHKVEVETNDVTEKLSANYVTDIEQTALKLTSQRKLLRKQQSYFEQFPSPQILSNYEIKQQHTQTQGGTSLDIQANYVIVGGQAGLVSLYRSETLLYKNQQSNQRINTIKFFTTDEHLRFVSSTSDGDLVIYQFNTETNEGVVTQTVKVGQNITGLAIHPLGYIAIIVTSGGLLLLYDLRSGQQISRVTDFEGQCQFTSVGIHPDGLLLAIGQENSQIKIWKITSGQLVAQFEGQEGSISQVAFSENGVNLASVSSTEVFQWDLRNPGQFQKLFQSQNISSISYDTSGAYLAVGENKNIHLFDIKKQQEFFKFESHRDVVTAIKFAEFNKNIYSCSFDKQVNIYGN